MADSEPKKLLILYILNILRKHTDPDHPLPQQKIVELLESEYGMTADRKTVRRNLSKLMEAGYPIRYQGSTMDSHEFRRKGKNGGEQTILTNWYYCHQFEYGELSLLIDSVLFADGLSKRHRTELIQKIEALTSKHFHSVRKKIDMDIYGKLVNPQIIFTIENIRQAIAKGRQLQFQYFDIGTDFKLHPRTVDGKPRIYTVNPYQIIAKNGHQYLISGMEQKDGLTHFRIDRIKNSNVLDTPAKKLRELRGFENGLLLSEYVKAHPYLWSGEVRHITFRCRQYMMNDVVDCFGTDLHIEQQPDDMILVHVYASEENVLLWAVQFADDIEVLSPQSLREQIAEKLRSAVEKYGK
ncbi:MAG: WYL domain-containing protein [Oscillospiraceae bacterium]|nr:WYL domain-containing protein [Oscillospiraceae bacterium]